MLVFLHAVDRLLAQPSRTARVTGLRADVAPKMLANELHRAVTGIEPSVQVRVL